MNGEHIVFVYGTLKRGYPNAHVGMPLATYLGDYRTKECYPLVIGGRWFTPYLIDEPGTGCQVTGEVYSVNDSVLAELDTLESVHLPNGYRRRQIGIEVTNDGERGNKSGQDRAITTAWVYLKARQHIDGIHDGPMPTYPLDSRYVHVEKR